ncbi:MAG: ParA family protein [Actinobacteria bacterium]|nr:ParA family protein [Actinomycetota bacterium]NCW47566.1 ParA family protein [Actinomycetota bacterium]NCW76190.1 ParA family protein [Actinomycetota bacterium]NDB50168.1 ParA family protein [Actinomycetota bacterium]NDG09843.1 ParA family protein [Actinomycetota bacterium]
MPRPISTRIFTVANQKGGVGKTTSAVNIAAALAMGGLRTLVIDLDPQGNASTAFGVQRDEVNGMYEVIIKDLPVKDAALKVPGYPALEIIPATQSLANAEVELVPLVARELRLKRALTNYLNENAARGERFDYVIIDCPPSLGLLTINALVAADELLIPIQCEYYSLEGLTLLLHTVTLIQEHLNQNLKLTTIVLTMYDGRTRLANDVAEEIRKHYPNELIDIPIPRAVRVSEAPSYGQTVMTYDPGSNGADAYARVAREIARRGAPTITSAEVG